MANENEKKENVVAEQQQPKQIVLYELDKSKDRVDFSKLPQGDQFQVLTRYLNDMCSFARSTLQIAADTEVLLEFIAKKLGINIAEERQKLVAEMQKKMEEQEKLVKEAMAKAAKENKSEA